MQECCDIYVPNWNIFLEDMVTAFMYFEFHRNVFNKCKLVDSEESVWYIWNLSFIFHNKNKMLILGMAWLSLDYSNSHVCWNAVCQHFLCVSHLILTLKFYSIHSTDKENEVWSIILVQVKQGIQLPLEQYGD